MIKRIIGTFYLILVLFFTGRTQEAHFPIVKGFGGIFEVAEATVRPDPQMTYKMVIDIYSGPSDVSHINPALNNVARMLNLHGIAGVKAENLNTVLAIHGDATWAVLNEEAFRRRYGRDNPNIPLIKALRLSGVKMAVCGQSLLGKEVSIDEVNKDIEIATSMLTTMTKYQMLGYGYLRF